MSQTLDSPGRGSPAREDPAMLRPGMGRAHPAALPPVSVEPGRQVRRMEDSGAARQAAVGFAMYSVESNGRRIPFCQRSGCLPVRSRCLKIGPSYGILCERLRGIRRAQRPVSLQPVNTGGGG